MISIKEFSDILPIKCRYGELNFLSFDKLDWYVDNCRKDYYNEHLDFNFKSDITREDLYDTFYNLVIGQKLKEKSDKEARLVLKNEVNDCIGGALAYELQRNNVIELAYFVVPEYQHMGIAYDMLKSMIEALNKSKLKFRGFIATIQYDNVASINLVKKLGFRLLSEADGKYKKNITMYLDRTYET